MRQEVWQLLKDSLGEDDVLLANRRLTDEAKDHEAGLIVLMPDLGIVVVKLCGSVWYEDDWKMRGHHGVPRDANPAPVFPAPWTSLARRD